MRCTPHWHEFHRAQRGRQDFQDFGYKTEQRSDTNVQQQYHRPLWLSFPAESGMAISPPGYRKPQAMRGAVAT